MMCPNMPLSQSQLSSNNAICSCDSIPNSIWPLSVALQLCNQLVPRACGAGASILNRGLLTSSADAWLMVQLRRVWAA